MALEALGDEVAAALVRIRRKNPESTAAIDKAAGYALFPSVGRASLLLGGAYGRGLVFAHGKPIGEATLGQMTIGAQVGGQTFSELVIFNSDNALERFKRGRIAFSANASATIVKAAATGASDYEKDVAVKAFGLGGMLLELSLGGQVFKFRPADGAGAATIQQPRADEGGNPNGGARGEARKDLLPEQPSRAEPGAQAAEGQGERIRSGSRRVFGRATSGVIKLFGRGDRNNAGAKEEG